MDPATKKQTDRLPFVAKAPNAVTMAAMEAADRGGVDRTSLAQLARDWDGACAKSPKHLVSKKT
jgi:hypothetical protein